MWSLKPGRGLYVAGGALARRVPAVATGRACPAFPLRPLAVAVVLSLAVQAHCLAAEPKRHGEAVRLTIGEAIRLALGDGRAAVRARLARDETKLDLEAAEDRYGPRADVGLSGQARREADGTADVSIGSSLRIPTGGVFRLTWSNPVVNKEDRSSRAELRFTQPLLKGFGAEVDTAPLRRARIGERIAERVFREAASGIVVSVVSAWRGLSRAGRRVAIARSALERARRQLAVNRVLVEAGQLASLELVQTEAEVAEREYALIDAENAREIAHAALVDVLDLEEGVRLELAQEAAVTRVQPDPPDLGESLKTAFARRADWLQAELGVALARIDLRVAENNRLWDLSMDVSVSRGASERDVDYGVLFNLSVPLYRDDTRRALIRARNGLLRAQMARDETRQAIGIAIRRAVNDVGVALRRIVLARRARELAEQKLDVERRKLRQGLSSSFQLGRFENDLVGAENRELDAVVGYRNSRTALSRALGTTLDRWGIGVERVGR